MLNAKEIMELQNIAGMEKFSKLTVKQALDREKLIELLTQVAVVGDYLDMRKVADHLIANDVVPVVRCKDCKHYKPRNQSVYWNETTPCCHRSAALKFPADGFCSYGERREGE